jgi:hypothetical protein
MQTAPHRTSLVPAPLLASLGFLLALFSILALPSVQAQTATSLGTSPGAISGTISQPPGGASVQGLTVTVVERDQTTSTDANGHFNLLQVAPGTYTLTVTGPGYAKLTIQEVMVQSGQTTSLSNQVMPTKAEGTVSAMSGGIQTWRPTSSRRAAPTPSRRPTWTSPAR